MPSMPSTDQDMTFDPTASYTIIRDRRVLVVPAAQVTTDDVILDVYRPGVASAMYIPTPERETVTTEIDWDALISFEDPEDEDVDVDVPATLDAGNDDAPDAELAEAFRSLYTSSNRYTSIGSSSVPTIIPIEISAEPTGPNMRYWGAEYAAGQTNPSSWYQEFASQWEPGPVDLGVLNTQIFTPEPALTETAAPGWERFAVPEYGTPVPEVNPGFTISVGHPEWPVTSPNQSYDHLLRAQSATLSWLGDYEVRHEVSAEFSGADRDEESIIGVHFDLISRRPEGVPVKIERNKAFSLTDSQGRLHYPVQHSVVSRVSIPMFITLRERAIHGYVYFTVPRDIGMSLVSFYPYDDVLHATWNGQS